MKQPDVEASQLIQLADLIDLLRLLAARSVHNNGSGYLYYGTRDGKHIYFITHTVGGWYDLRGLPVTMMVSTDVEPSSPFIEYTSPTSGRGESFEFVKEIKQATTSVTIPVIKLAELPEFMI